MDLRRPASTKQRGPARGFDFGRHLRYALVLLLLDAGAPMTVPQLIDGLVRAGWTIPGRPSKTVSDSLRWAVRKGRVIRSGRGRYELGHVPRSTQWYLRQRVAAFDPGSWRSTSVPAAAGSWGQAVEVSDEPTDRDGLYALDPKEFVAGRNALVKRLKAAGEKEEAADVAKLKRPTPGAWALNQVARGQPALVEAALAAGQQLRQATDDAMGGDAAGLREATAVERSSSGAVVDAALAHLGTGGPQARTRVMATVHAATIDDEVADRFRRGVLSVDEERSGLGFGFGFDADPGPMAPPRPGVKRPNAGPKAAKGQAATEPEDEDAARAAEEAKAAEEARVERERRLAELRSAAEEARAEAERLGENAERLEAEAESAAQRARAAREAAEDAQRVAEVRDRALEAVEAEADPPP